MRTVEVISFKLDFMWQHAANICIGLLLMAGSFIAVMMGNLNSGLLWPYVGAGAIVAGLGLWGFLDEVEYESGSEREKEAGMM